MSNKKPFTLNETDFREVEKEIDFRLRTALPQDSWTCYVVVSEIVRAWEKIKKRKEAIYARKNKEVPCVAVPCGEIPTSPVGPEPGARENCTCDAAETGLVKLQPWQERFVKEYHELKDRYNKLHKMLVKQSAGTLDFKPACPPDLLRDQARIMLAYLTILEERAEYEHINL